MRCPTLAAVAVILLPVAALAETYRVRPDGSGDFPTIQEALNAADTGDTVLVSPGEFHESLFWPFRNGITLRGAGMDSTLVLGNESETVLLMIGTVAIDSTTVIERLRLRNGGDAGIAIAGSSPVIDSCAVDSTRLGPAIHCFDGSGAQVRNSLIADNMSIGVVTDGEVQNCDIANNDGAGIVTTARVSDSRITGNASSGIQTCAELQDCVISDNDGVGVRTTASIWGSLIAGNMDSGVVANSSDCLIVVEGCTITGNSTDTFGGGVRCDEAFARIYNNVITSNHGDQGGGIHCNPGCVVEIVENHIDANTATTYGGGVYTSNCSPDILGNTIADNAASNMGGGIYTTGDSPTISENAVSHNSASSGGGISCSASAATIFSNTITDNVGEGIRAQSGSPTIQGNQVLRNTGYGIYCLYGTVLVRDNTIGSNLNSGMRIYQSSAQVEDNVITGNSSMNGGGILCQSAHNSDLLGNEITGNVASGSGGGIYCTSTYGLEILANTIVANTAAGAGGGMYCEEYSIVVSGNTLKGNTCGTGGGGLYCRHGSPVLTGNRLVANHSGATGGGLECYEASPTITENVIVENGAETNGGGVACIESEVVAFTRNTLSRNVALMNGGATFLVDSGSPEMSVSTATENEAGALGDAFYVENSRPTITGCNIAYNGWGMHNTSYQDVPVIQGNWWGHESGPWHSGGNPGGLGDSLSLYAYDFVPWLPAADTEAPPPSPRGAVVDSISGSSILLSWQPVPLGDLSGYRVYFDSDTTGFPYEYVVDAGMGSQCLIEDLEEGTEYYMAVTCYDVGNDESWYSVELVDSTLAGQTGVLASSGTWRALELGAPRPNPCRGHTILSYNLPAEGSSRLTVHDAQGRCVAILGDGVCGGGLHSVVWHGEDRNGHAVAPGVYMVRLESQGRVDTRKILLVR